MSDVFRLMDSATKNTIADVNGNNCEILNMKIQYVLEKQEALEALDHVMEDLEDVVRHLELVEDRLTACESKIDICNAGSSSERALSSKRKRIDSFNMWECKGSSPYCKRSRVNQHKRGKRPQVKKMPRVRCYNCDKKCYYARNCCEPKKVNTFCTFENFAYVSSSVFLIESNSLWNVDS